MSRPEKGSGPPTARRWSTSLFMVTLRSRLSWTRWRRSRRERRLDKAVRRLRLLERLQAEQLLLVRRLEAELSPPRVIQLGHPPEPPRPEALDRIFLLPEPVEQPRFRPEQPEPEPEPEQPEEPMPDPLQEIAQRLGLQPPPT